ncbi:MAG: hypothetical protein ABI895_24710 [Deltaproteobacteria bacterium]
MAKPVLDVEDLTRDAQARLQDGEHGELLGTGRARRWKAAIARQGGRDSRATARLIEGELHDGLVDEVLGPLPREAQRGADARAAMRKTPRLERKSISAA